MADAAFSPGRGPLPRRPRTGPPCARRGPLLCGITLGLLCALPGPARAGEYLPNRRSRILTRYASPWETGAPLDREITLYRRDIGVILRVGEGGAFTTVQAAIDHARDGDVVLIAPGTYVENLALPGRRVILIGEGGAKDTIIDGGRCTRGLDACSTLDATAQGLGGSWIEGLTLKGGLGTVSPEADLRAWDPYADPALGGAPSLGGVVLATQGGLSLVGCHLHGGEADLGGGIALFGPDSRMMSELRARSIDARRGGADVDTEGGEDPRPDLFLAQTQVVANHGREWGGGIYVDGAHLVVNGGRISGNQSARGGGLALREGLAFLTEVELLKDRASLIGGGILVDGGAVTGVNLALVEGYAPEGSLAQVLRGALSLEEGYAVFPDGGPGLAASATAELHLAQVHGATRSRPLFATGTEPSPGWIAESGDPGFVALSPEGSFLEDDLGAWRRGEPGAIPGLWIDLGAGLAVSQSLGAVEELRVEGEATISDGTVDGE